MKSFALWPMLGCSCILFAAQWGVSNGQLTATPISSIPVADELTTSNQLVQTDQVLSVQFAQLLAEGATSDQITYWQTQNQSQFNNQETLSIQLAADVAALPMPSITPVAAPIGASADLQDLLADQTDLANLYAQIHNQLLEAGTDSSDQETTLFQQQAGPTQADSAQCSAAIAATVDQQAWVVPPGLVMPPNATPALQAYLTLSDQLMRSQAALHNQNLTFSAATQAALMQQWTTQNTSSLTQLQVLAQNLATTTQAVAVPVTNQEEN